MREILNFSILILVLVISQYFSVPERLRWGNSILGLTYSFNGLKKKSRVRKVKLGR